MACIQIRERRERVSSLSRASLERALPSGEPVLLDTSTLAAYFGDEPTSAVAATFIDDFVRSGRNRALISAVSATELLVRPLRTGHDDVARALLNFLRTFANVEVVPVDLAVASIAARLRARESMKAADALIAASGLDRSAPFAVSDDAGWPAVLAHGPARMKVLALRTFLPFT